MPRSRFAIELMVDGLAGRFKLPVSVTSVAFPSELHAIYRAEFGHVVHTLRRFGVRERDVEDVAHDVFVTVHQRLSDYDRARPFRPWISGIVYRTALNYRRLSRHRHEVHDYPADVSDGARPADEALADWQARRIVQEAIGTIDLERRAVLVMHDIDGIPMNEVAEALAIPANTGYSRLRLARKELEAAVRKIQGREGRS